MHLDKFGIVGKNDVVRSWELLDGLRHLRAGRYAERHDRTDVELPGLPAAPSGVEPLDVFDACRRLAELGAQVILLPSPCHQHLLPLLVDEVGVPILGLPAVLNEVANDGANDGVNGGEIGAASVDASGHDKRVGDDLDRRLADHALRLARSGPRDVFRLGVVGGVGPAATVDFLSKVVRGTHAACDQDHLKILLEQNPQIPDRTAFLLNRGADPAVALYATCRRLERQGASVIAIPCNTAHAFLPRIAHRLRVPVVDMIAETLDRIVEQHGSDIRIGLLATSGTVNSGVYAAAARQRGVTLLAPSKAAQAQVMQAIYGPVGIKAGYTQGVCETQLQVAIHELVSQGARVLILGCTELPMVLQGAALYVDGAQVDLVDPTEILARRCVALALGTPQPAK